MGLTDLSGSCRLLTADRTGHAFKLNPAERQVIAPLLNIDKTTVNRLSTPA